MKFSPPSARIWCPAIGVLALWVTVWMRLKLEWSVNPNYAFGWAVPAMAVFLWIRREREFAGQSIDPMGNTNRAVGLALAVGVTAVLALLLPLRIISEANPVWRGSQWALASTALLASLTLIAIFRGRAGIRAFFPVCVFPFVAVPLMFDWESAMILFLSKWNTAGSADILQTVGIPAVASGTILRVGETSLNVQEACSGIRSLHLAIALSFFWCVLYQLPWKSWIVVGLGSITFAFVFNILRNISLAFLVHSGGEEAFTAYHELAGWCAQFALTVAVWSVVNLVQRNSRPKWGTKPASDAAADRDSTLAPVSNAMLAASTCGIVLWLAIIEIGTEWWFQRNAAPDSAAAQEWSIAPTANLVGRKFIPRDLDKETARALRVDEARVLEWLGTEGKRRELYFLRWSPENTSKNGVLVHSPETCLTAVGMKLAKAPVPVDFDMDGAEGGLVLPFAVSEFAHGPRPVTVFFCLWDDQTGPVFQTKGDPLAYETRLTAAWKGERQNGQRILEVAMWDTNRESAETEFQALLPTIIRCSGTPRVDELQKSELALSL